MKTITERLAKVNERRASLAHRIAQLREIRGEGNLYMADVLEDNKLRLDQLAYELNLAASAA